MSDYKFFQGLEGGNLNFLSNFDNKESTNLLNINNFKLNEAPALAKLLSLADLKGLTDTLKGDGISFDTLSVKYSSDSSQMTIQEIFMIGPSISILMDGYVEKNGLVSLKGPCSSKNFEQFNIKNSSCRRPIDRKRNWRGSVWNKF